MALPRHLRNFNIMIDGVGFAGRADEVILPTLSLATEEHRAGGMDSPVDVDMGMELMELSVVISDYDESIFTGFGLLGPGVPLTLRGAIQRQGEDAQAVVVKMLGGLKSRGPGPFTTGGKQTTELTYSLRKYSESINGTEYVNIDVENMVRVINGVDQLASQRAAIGL
jgi:P2 family phage contractile tail tube protein